MRVIAGTAGGIPLRVPNSQMRPTMDLVRGAVFSSLADAVPGARILDLFAGSGSLGIEALSRGAAEAWFVESDRRACACIEENLQKTRLSGTVRKSDVFDFIRRNPLPWPADIAFADPPYLKKEDSPDFAATLMLSPDLPPLLAPGATLILEVQSGWNPPSASVWECLRRKKYGSTEILFLCINPSLCPDAPPVHTAPSSRALP